MAEQKIISAEIEKPFRFADFDVRVLKRHLRKQANKIRKEARRLVSKRGVSNPGDFPGLRTGRMRKGIKVEVWKSGYGATIRPTVPDKTAPYPQYVVFGHLGPKKTSPKTAARANFMVAAADRVGEGQLKEGLRIALESSFKPTTIL